MNPCVAVTGANDDVRHVVVEATRPLASLVAKTACAPSRETLPKAASPVGNVFGGGIFSAGESAAQHREARSASSAARQVVNTIVIE